MNRSLRILLIVLSLIGVVAAFRLYLVRDRDPMYYYDGLKKVRIGVFKNWRIHPRDVKDESFYLCRYEYFKITKDSSTIDTTLEYMFFGFVKSKSDNIEILNPKGNMMSDAHFYEKFSEILKVDSCQVKDTLMIIIKEFFKSKAFAVGGATDPKENWISFDFGKEGNICLLYSSDNIENYKKKFNNTTTINKNWLYWLREKQD